MKHKWVHVQDNADIVCLVADQKSPLPVFETAGSGIWRPSRCNAGLHPRALHQAWLCSDSTELLG
jgi:hypothetical protein